jgi:hypothetical protein
LSTARRIGRFLVIIGLGLIGLFVLSDMAQFVNYNFLVIGALVFGIGIFLIITSPKPEPTPNPRFRSLNKILKKEEETREKEKRERK